MKFQSMHHWHVSFLAVALTLLIVGCGSDRGSSATGDDTASTETTASQAAGETAPPPPPPPPAVKQRSEMKQKTRSSESDEEFDNIEEDEIVMITHEEVPVEFIPHRFVYEVNETHHETSLRESMAAFDVAPHYGAECMKRDNPDKCSQMNVERYLKNNLEVPDEAKNLEHPVEYVAFVVGPDGEIDDDNIQVLPQEPTCHTCAAAALVAIRRMPKWQPGQLNGQPVAVRVTLPVAFDASE